MADKFPGLKKMFSNMGDSIRGMQGKKPLRKRPGLTQKQLEIDEALKNKVNSQGMMQDDRNTSMVDEANAAAAKMAKKKKEQEMRRRILLEKYGDL